MSYAQVGFFMGDFSGGPAGADVFTGTTPSSGNDWGASIIPGSPGTPTSVVALTFGPVSGPASASPYGTPFFWGLFIEPIVSGVHGVAMCSGPAPSVHPILSGEWAVDPADLTVVKSWLVSEPDSIASWIPIDVGGYYYLIVECYNAGTGVGALGRVGENNFVRAAFVFPQTTYPTTSQEEILPVGSAFQANGIADAAGPFDLDIDWGDGTAGLHRTYAHSGLGTIEDDLFLDESGGTLESLGGTISHTYAAVGLYDIAVTLTDANSGVSTQTITVAAVGPPTVSLVVTPSKLHGLPGTVTIELSGHSDAWSLMRFRDPSINPDEYDPTRFGLDPGAKTDWTFEISPGDGYGSDHVTVARWVGPGEPPNDPHPSSPPPTEVWFPDDSTNRILREFHDPARLQLFIADFFGTWTQLATVEVDLPLGFPWQRNFPRDDGHGISSARSFPPQVDSIRSYPTIP